jgi:phosphatidylserine decarboxylase
MTIHKEGYKTISLIGLGVSTLIFFSLRYLQPEQPLIHYVLSVILVAFWVFIVSFFRIPSRNFTYDENAIVSPADGKVVVIEEVFDTEYFNDKRLQVSDS